MSGAPNQTYFFGRPAERMRFKKGDIVEVVDGDTVKLAVVADDGPSIECFWELYQCNCCKACQYNFLDLFDTKNHVL